MSADSGNWSQRHPWYARTIIGFAGFCVFGICYVLVFIELSQVRGPHITLPTPTLTVEQLGNIKKEYDSRKILYDREMQFAYAYAAESNYNYNRTLDIMAYDHGYEGRWIVEYQLGSHQNALESKCKNHKNDIDAAKLPSGALKKRFAGWICYNTQINKTLLGRTPTLDGSVSIPKSIINVENIAKQCGYTIAE